MSDESNTSNTSSLKGPSLTPSSDSRRDSSRAAQETCQNCKNDFVIESEDFEFYKKMNVPPPTFCPECRLIRRMMWRYNRTLYKVSCELCGEETISVYHPDSSAALYCSTCWWSDGWDALEHGREYDFSRSFLEQFSELLKVVPREASANTKSINCDYSPSANNSKNCYLSFGAYFSEDCMYCFAPVMSRNCIDSDLGLNMDHAYGCHNSDGIYNTKFVWLSEECIDSSFLFDCIGCTNCFGCVNLRNAKYRIFNKQYTKEEYKKEMEYWDLGSNKILEEAKKKFTNFYYSMPRRYAWTTNVVNVSGDNVKNSKNCKICFTALNGVDDCKFMFTAALNFKDSYDSGFGGEKCELCYETLSAISSQRSIATRGSTNLVNAEYCVDCRGGENLFGCTQLRNKSYCILNKQYSKEEYFTLREKIIEHMNTMLHTDDRGKVYKYGEFLPHNMSPWAYNETLAQEWFPLSKEEALAQGFTWHDPIERNYKISLKTKDIPDHIKDIDEGIAQEVITCAHAGKCNDGCTTAFKILPEELAFYKQMNLALPRLCHNCRYYERIRLRNPAKLWKRKCQCGGHKSENNSYTNQSDHFHGTDHCSNEFETAIGPDRKEIVYCQQCYNDEFV